MFVLSHVHRHVCFVAHALSRVLCRTCLVAPASSFVILIFLPFNSFGQLHLVVFDYVLVVFVRFNRLRHSTKQETDLLQCELSYCNLGQFFTDLYLDRTCFFVRASLRMFLHASFITWAS